MLDLSARWQVVWWFALTPATTAPCCCPTADLLLMVVASFSTSYGCSQCDVSLFFDSTVPITLSNWRRCSEWDVVRVILV